MADVRWTAAQLDAIESRGSNILVSAAAGSGKTAVLVERVIRQIVEEKHDANRFLIVTFTRDAAFQLKTKLANAIDKKLNEAEDEEERNFLTRQKNLIPLAQISTIDSFTSKLVKSNYQLFGLNPKFEIFDGNELEMFSSRIIDEIFEEFYQKAEQGKDDVFLELADNFSSGNSDDSLKKFITDLNDKGEAYPFFDEWLFGLLDNYDEKDFSSSVYGELYFATALELINYAESLNFRALEICGEMVESVYNTLLSDRDVIAKVREYVQKKNFATLSQILNVRQVFKTMRIKKGDEAAEEIKEKVKPIRDVYKDAVGKVKDMFVNGYDPFDLEIQQVSRYAEELVNITKAYHDKLLSRKKEQNKFTFNDILHFAIELLVDENGNLTDLAQTMKNNYVEICIDEFQDTNKAQTELFEAISSDNLFVVGDVKQSIYRFRMAQPELFNQIKETKKLPNGDDVKVIILGNNFRSRKSVTESTNFVFRRIMSKEMGEIEYNSDEELIQTRSCTETDEAVELHILNSKDKDDDETKEAFQAQYIADLIKEKLDSGFEVMSSAGGMRPCRASDFYVIFDSAKGVGIHLVDELKKRGIGSYIEQKKEFFESYEISLILSLIEVIDNPEQDIPLAAVMMSVLFGFTADEMAALRVENRVGSLHRLLQNSADTNEKCAYLLEKLKNWRHKACTMGAEAFLRSLYDETDIESFTEVMSSPSVKRKNLSLLLHYATKYEQAGYTGISGFIRYIGRMKDKSLDLEGSSDKSAAADAVAITTIHKSKGLQAPIVIVGNCGHEYNMDNKGSIRFSTDYAFGMKLRHETPEGIRYLKDGNYTNDIIKAVEERQLKAERLRLLYVAMTRAEERLILVGMTKSVTLSSTEYDGKRVHPYKVFGKKNFLSLLIPALAQHPDAGSLRELAAEGDEIKPLKDAQFRLEIFTDKQFETPAEKVEEVKTTAEVDSKLMTEINDAVNFQYKYLPLTGLSSKMAASDLDEKSVDSPYFAQKKPSFMCSGGFSASQKGTITHEFMQYLDFDVCRNSSDIEDALQVEIFRMTTKHILTQEEADAIDMQSVRNFFSSDLAKRMMASPNLMREKKFMVHLPIDYYNSEFSDFRDSGAQLTIQGIADAAFEEDGKLVIVDYKTDHMKTEQEFIDHYRNQISTYKAALVQCTDYDEVSSMVLYSFFLNKAIEVT